MSDESPNIRPDDDDHEEIPYTSLSDFSANLDSEWAVGQELTAEELFEQWSRQDQLEIQEGVQSARRFSVGRSPLLLVVVIAFATMLSVSSYPALEALIQRDHFDECGDLASQSQLKSGSIGSNAIHRHLR